MWDECNCVVVWAFFGIAFLWDWNENWPFPVLWPLLSFPNLLAHWVQHFHCCKGKASATPNVSLFSKEKQVNDGQNLFIWSRNHKQMGILSGNVDKFLEIKHQNKKLLGVIVIGRPTYVCGGQVVMFRNSTRFSSWRAKKNHHHWTCSERHVKIISSGRRKIIEFRNSDLHKQKRALEKEWMKIKFNSKKNSSYFL